MTDRRQLIADLKHCVAEIVFVREGVSWTMRCTLARSNLPEVWVDDGDQERLKVWDVESRHWHTLFLNDVTSTQVVNTP